MKQRNDEWSRLRRWWRAEVDRYFDAVTDASSTPERKQNALARLGAVSIRLRFFEQGRRSKR